MDRSDGERGPRPGEIGARADGEARRAAPLIRPIPTTYAGIRFRSRLEAKWACLFDLLKWKWTYEPTDLEFYIPDFVLRFDAGLVAVEVKPELELEALKPHLLRTIRAGWSKEALVVGATLFREDTIEPVIGLLADRHVAPFDAEPYIERGVFFRCIDCGELSLRSEAGSWKCRACGSNDGGSHVGTVEIGEIEDKWDAATNRVQWRPGT